MLTKKDKKKRYNRPYKQGRGHQFSGWTDATETAFKEDTGGAVSGLVGAASAGINAGMQNAELVGVEEAQEAIDARKNFTSAASTNDDLLAEMASATNSKADFDFKDFMQDGKTLAMNTINATMQGAASGASAGPWGAVAGAAAGLLGGIGGIIGGRVKAGVEAAQKKEAARKANMAQAQTLTSKAGALDQTADARSLAAYYAEGGRLGKTPQFPEFPSSLVKFNTGGTHEENPHDGIPQGIAPDGLPNLVEEGEVKYDDYIFSDRLMLDKKDKKKYKFLSGNTYADAAEKISKESAERPNDIISKNTRDANLKVLEFLQERERQKRGLQGENRMMYAFGGHTFDATSDTSTPPEVWIDNQGNPFYVSNWGQGNQVETLMSLGYKPGWGYKAVNKDTKGAVTVSGAKYLSGNGKNRMSLVDPNNITGKGDAVEYNKSSEKYFLAPEQHASLSKYEFTPVQIDASDDDDMYVPYTIYNSKWLGTGTGPLKDLETKVAPVIETDLDLSGAKDLYKKTALNNNKTKFNYNSLLQAAPALGNAIGMLTQAFNTPDYKHAKELQKGEQNTFTPISYTPLTQRMTYKPMDVNYYGSKLGAQAGAARQAIRQQTASNPYAATAALLAADAHAQGQLGDLYKKAEEYNLAQREKVENFNRSTGAVNAEMAIKAQQLNASLRDAAAKRQLSRDELAARLKLMEDQAFSESMSTSMTGLFDNLGAIGKENKEFDLAALKMLEEGKLTPEQFSLLFSQIQKRLKEAGYYSKGGKLKKKKGYTI